VNVLLDTNVYSAFFRGRAEAVELIKSATSVYLSVFVIGELLDGFRRGSRPTDNWRDLQSFLDSPRVKFLPATIVTADRYSRVVASLRAKGRPLPTNDVWIAAHAMEVGADLVSYDRHFAEIDGLVWVVPGENA
jgi:tRNA(fMet)-specific endonuclease VapC